MAAARASWPGKPGLYVSWCGGGNLTTVDDVRFRLRPLKTPFGLLGRACPNEISHENRRRVQHFLFSLGM